MDDVAPEGALHAVFLRSPVAHARIGGLDVAAARGDAGRARGLAPPPTSAGGSTTRWTSSWCSNRDGTLGAAPRRPILAEDRVRYAGEAIALVVAETRAAAMDAAEPIVCRLRRPAGACGDGRGRAGDPPRGAGQRRLRLGVRRRGGGGGGFAAAAHTHAAGADRQPGDGDADGAARLLCGVGRRAAARGLLRAGRLGAAGRAGGAAGAAGGGGAGDDPGRGRRLRDQGLQLSGVFRRRLRGARAGAAGALDEHAAARRC